MDQQFSRTVRLLGEEALQKLRRSHVAVFGLGGVGSFAAESLIRCGVGRLTLVDADCVEPSNLNRQLLALHSTIDRPKALVMAERAADICPDTEVYPKVLYFDASTASLFDFSLFDYVVDAIDSVDSKELLILTAQAAGVPIVSSMGTGNKLDPSALALADLYETSVCPLARVMRQRLKRAGVQKLKVVYSKEPPVSPPPDGEGRHTPASAPFVPPAAGMLLASAVVRDLCAPR